MGRKALTKKQKVINLLSNGRPVSWTALRNKFDLTSPRAMVDQLRTEDIWCTLIKHQMVLRIV